MYAPLIALFGALFGLVVGSFLNVVIHRLPLMLDALDRGEKPALTLARPGSHCPACRHPLPARHNIPVLSWLLLRGRCAFCNANISARYPLVELLTAALTVVVCTLYGVADIRTVAGLILVWTLVCLTFIDLRTHSLPDELTLPLLWCGLLTGALGGFASPADAIIGAAAGYLSFRAIYEGFKRCTGREGLGFGDMKLLAALGAFFGWQALPSLVLVAALGGLAVGVTLIVLRKLDRRAPIPFGPYLALAGFAHLVFPVTRLYG